VRIYTRALSFSSLFTRTTLGLLLKKWPKGKLEKLAFPKFRKLLFFLFA